jgi:AraC-like DNA-binding protein
MKRSAPLLLPLLRTATQGEIIAWLFLHPEESTTIIDLARRLGTSAPTVMREPIGSPTPG